MSASERIVSEFPELFEDAFDVDLPAGWLEIARKCCAVVSKEAPDLRVSQLKEKFGGARFYYVGFATQKTVDAIDAFEKQSYQTCQLCGAPGKGRGERWIITMCDGCFK